MSCLSQGFVNLNFESAVLITNGSTQIAIVVASNAIPGWTATGYLGPDFILCGSASAGSSSVSILVTNGLDLPIDGAYSILLYGGHSAASASISQTGIVPASAVSILFKANFAGPPGGILLVSLGGQNIDFSAISNGPNYTLYGGDISAFAGQSEQLMFSALRGENLWNIDDIQFSSTPVPEPSTFALAALGGLLLGFRRILRVEKQ